jgi:hypothetical protein
MGVSPMHSRADASLERTGEAPVPRKRVPLTFWVGLAIIAACEVLLFADVAWSKRGALHSNQQIAALEPPTTSTHHFARFVAVNMTPLVWPGYVLVLDGLLVMLTGTSAPRRRPHHFATLFFASIVIWCVFDWVNFYFIHAWSYLGLPRSFWSRSWGYVLAFGCILPGMLLSGQLFLDLGWFNAARGGRFRLPAWVPPVVLIIGVAMFAWPLISRDPVSNFTLWTSLVFLLDPINLWLGRPSVLRDWQAGWYGRTLAAFAGGLLCGLLWEFWNYWALAKWIYHLPFLGPLEHVRYFEMPLPGLLGFIPFGLECWVMWQTMRIPLDGMVEPLPDEHSLL